MVLLSPDLTAPRRDWRKGAGSFPLAHAKKDGVPHYILNSATGEAAQRTERPERAADLLRAGMWGVGADEPHRDALAAGDLVLIYLGAPEWELIGRAELASAVHAWTPAEARVYPGDSSSGVLLAQVEECNPPVPMNTVLSRLDPAAKADFDKGVVRIDPHEYETVLVVAAERAAPRLAD